MTSPSQATATDCASIDQFALNIDHVSKRYRATQALNDVSVCITGGEVHSLVGANGAGKSTFLKVLTGAIRPDFGSIELDGNLLNLTPSEARRSGIAMVHQETALVPQLTVAQNVTLGLQVDQGPRRRLGLIDRRSREAVVAPALMSAGYAGDPDAKVTSLSTSQRQLVEIAHALATNAKVIAFDEPTSSLSPAEVDHLLAIINRLKSAGNAILYVSHRLDEVLRVSDQITVLRGGRVVKRYRNRAGVADLTTQKLVTDMMGVANSQSLTRPPVAKSGGQANAIEVRSLTSPGKFADVSFSVSYGEVLGIFGLVGAGRSEVLNAVYGILPASGTVTVDDRALGRRSPAAAIRHGIAYLPEDRKSQGLVLGRSIATNVTLPLHRHPIRGLSRRHQLVTAQEGMVRSNLDRDPHILARDLSGGTQQKALVARWMVKPHKVYMFDEPTRGIDVPTKVEIYRYIDQIAADGAAVIVVSSEVEEILRLSHRIMVMHEGRVVETLQNDELATTSSVAELANGIGDSQ